ncbi:hypothetical protein [Brevundimonas sp. EYE_349]|uniref:hypothetical protein n=1 Tax=Brevundimonas sp. EYE_349 TaxID=2853455 RepID=UPI0020046B4C|nr:hypothetical protein [Brevundimonas sp. EYE_349]MCK6102955.1 hypothetical protein [Brevundimonas sp. EYE_349]
MNCPSWVLATDPQTWSATADWVTAVAAAVGLGYLLWDRHRPRAFNFSTWTTSHRASQEKATRLDIFAVSLLAEPALLKRVSVSDEYELALRPLSYTVAKARAGEVELDWKKSVSFTQRPRVIGGAAADGKYSPIAAIFVRPLNSTKQVTIKLEFSRATDQRVVIKRSVHARLILQTKVKAHIFQTDRAT